MLSNLLDRSEKRGDVLEMRAALVFHCLGFHSAQIGYNTNSEAPDVVAHDPGGQMMVLIECMTGTPNNADKLAKLVHRARDLGDAIDREVMPVLVTNIRRANISQANLDAAAKDGIAVLAWEELETLGRMVYEVASPDDVEAFLRRHVPSTSGSGLRGRGLGFL